MSSLIVEVCAVEEIAPHSNADRLERVRVKNWWCIAPIGQHKVGDKVVYIPPDSVITEELGERWGISKYCSPLPKEMNGERPEGLRIRAVRFRGEPSFGTLQQLEDPNWEVGQNVIDYFGITKFEPPIKVLSGDIVPDVPEFHAYTDIENIGNFPNVFKEGEEVVVDEKIHGCFHAKTLITMVDGSKKKIINVKEGDFVLGTDEEGRVVPAEVCNTFRYTKTGKPWANIRGTRKGAGRGNHFFSLYCTDNHEFWSPEKKNYVAARNLSSHDAITVLRSELGMTPAQEQILLGKLLGDACLQIAGITASIVWSQKVKEYSLWTAKEVGLDFTTDSLGERTSGFGTKMFGKQTVFRTHVKEMFAGFYDRGKKTVPLWVEDKLTPLSLAYWYMDDGSLGHDDRQEDRAHFAVCSFDEDDCAILMRGLKKFGIESEYYLDGDRYSRLRLNADNAERLFLLIAPYIPSFMQNKLPERYRGQEAWSISQNDQPYKPWLTKQFITEVSNCDKPDSAEYDIETTTSNYFANDVLVHNSNCRVGISIQRREDTSDWVPTFMAGSHATRRKRSDDKGNASLYWKPFNKNIEDLLVEVFYANHKMPVVLFGEIFGAGVQDMQYGQKDKLFRVFDISIGGKYMDHCDKAELLGRHMVETVPYLYRGTFSMEKMNELVDGPTMVCNIEDIREPFKGREGIVIRPITERFDSDIGRTILKYVSVDYHERKNKGKTEDH